MPVIKCLNSRIQANEQRKCLKFLGIIPACVQDTLKSNPGEKIIFRCPACGTDVRWAAVYYNNGFVFEPDTKPEFGDNLTFDRIESVEQIA